MRKMNLFTIVLFSSFLFMLISVTTVSSNAVETLRISGSDRYYTSSFVAQDQFKTSDYAIIASGEKFPDALVAGTLSIPMKAPVLIVQKNNIPETINEALHNLKVNSIYIVGGENSVSKSVEDKLMKEYSIIRIAGKDRYETSQKLKKFKENMFGISAGSGVTGQVPGHLYPEALCASVVMSPKNYFLTLTKFLDGSTNYAFGSGPRARHVHGNSYSGWFDGKDKYTVSAQCANHRASYIVDELHRDIITVYLVSGEKLPDALCASGYMAANDAVLMLTPKNNVDKYIYRFLKENKVNRVVIVGGQDSVSMIIDEKLDNYDIYR
ncbi:cell wall-binding repeat-containing protein [Peptostreptococcus porci]|uniref:cell wall-binding repeat-containing protein n=1 Tax=Peptostreptococcus porci TaxID=2652282 RepID=UPI002A910A60|nr:cell wall-binding repeat-containing protein [Peptostreptococcus porci]MDY5435729.1 cell wall-binding repeat-containing protein [Peptostreptococcus porci]